MPRSVRVLLAAVSVAALTFASNPSARAQPVTGDKLVRVLQAARAYVAMRQPDIDLDGMYVSAEQDGDDYIVSYSEDPPGTEGTFHGVIVAIGVPDLQGRALAVVDVGE